MNFKKRVNGSWHDTPHYVHKTDTDTITTLPADIYPNATTATVGLKGNMSQTGTPSPDSPIMPEGTGERTGNLADVMPFSTKWATVFPNLVTFLNQLAAGNYTLSYDIELTQRNNVSDNSTYGIAIIGAIIQYSLRWDTAEVGTIRRVSHSFTISANMAGNIERAYAYGCGINGVGATGEARISNIMLNTGSTALPYEPHGYKIPISSASTTTPVYLGEVESTRRIRKLVLTGDKPFTKNDADSTHYLYYGSRGALLPNSIEKTPLLCNELPVTSGAPQSQVGISSNNNFNVVYLNFGADVMNAQPSGNTVAGLKEYLAQQYAAGTPVTVWYVLATPTTGIVNEPLRKIGEYADTVSGITIPTIAGGDTISVDTTLQPREVTINYKGWHPVIVHERTNGAWT